MAASVAIALTGADQQVLSGPGIYRGIVARETAGGTAVLQVRDGIGNTGTLLDLVSLAANGYASGTNQEVRFTTGLWVEVVSGSIEGSVRLG